MKLNYSKKILILSLFSFLTVLSVDIIFTGFLVNKIIGINDKVKQINTSSYVREKEFSLKDSIARSEIERGELEKYFIGTGNVGTLNFTKYLEELALKMGVTQKKSLEDVVIKGLETSDIVSAIRYRFNVSGKWENVYNFLLALETLPKVMSLNSVSFNLNSGTVSLNDVRTVDKIWSVDLDFSVAKLKK